MPPNQVMEFEAAHEVAAVMREKIETVLGAVLHHPNVMRTLQFTFRHLPSVRATSARTPCTRAHTHSLARAHTCIFWSRRKP